MLLIFVVPFWAALGAMLDASVDGVEIVRSYLKTGLGPPPDWLAKVPFGGERLTAKWQELSAGGPEQFAETIRPYVKSVAAWLVAVTGGFGGLLGHFLLTVIIAGILYATGETAAAGVRAFASRLAGERGDAAVILAGQSVQSVALGVVVTALVQTTLVGLGFFVAGIPHPGLLTAIVFVLCIAQVGPILVLIPAVIWMYSHASGVWATAFLIYSIPMAIARQLPAPDPHQSRSGSAVDPHHCRRHRRTHRVRCHRPVHRPGDPRRDVFVARRVDCRQARASSKGNSMRDAVREAVDRPESAGAAQRLCGQRAARRRADSRWPRARDRQAGWTRSTSGPARRSGLTAA